MPIELSELRKWKSVNLKDYPEISFVARELTHAQTKALTSTQRVLLDEDGSFLYPSKSDELEALISENSRDWKGLVLHGEEVTDLATIWELAPNRVVGGIIGALLRASTLSGEDLGNSGKPSGTPTGG